MARRIAAMIGSRANFASLRTVLLELRDRNDVDLTIIGFASATNPHYGRLAEIMAADDLAMDIELESLAGGGTPLAMTRTTGLSLIELASALNQAAPDIALVVGDRHEVLAAAVAAIYQNIPLAHTMGGEVTGTVDESVRHAISKLAHLHFPSTRLARLRLLQMGEQASSIFVTGCPRIDVAREAIQSRGEDDHEIVFGHGVGLEFSLGEPFLLVSQHPVTTEFGEAETQMTSTLSAVQEIGLPFILLWPNADAGSESTSRAIRRWREANPLYPAHFLRTLPMEIYLRLMSRASAMVGNSSSGLREGAYLGTPVVNIGSRQVGRERDVNVLDVDVSSEAVSRGIRLQIAHGRYASSPLYGDGHAGAQIARVLAEEPIPSVQKVFVDRNS